MELRTVQATRYVTPLREGGSLPGLIEADDLGMYVLKFRGAGHGLKALTAEIIVGELARELGFRVPEIVFVNLDPRLAKAEPDQEVQELLATSGGLNLGFDYLPGSFDFNPVIRDPGPELAARLLWLDALTLNVDRSWRNPNLLLWHRDVWLIDHGAALYFHHNFRPDWKPADTYRFDVRDHVMLPAAGPVTALDVTPEQLTRVLRLVPDDWLESDGVFSAEQARAAYLAFFESRLAHASSWLSDLEAARAARV
ncbi:MAG: HipA family kinase [Kibdelosporangium sp.]